MNEADEMGEYWDKSEFDEMKIKYFEKLNLLDSFFEPKRDREKSVWVKRNVAEERTNTLKFSFEVLGEDEENLRLFDEHIKSNYYDKLFANSKVIEKPRKTQSSRNLLISSHI